MIRRPAGAQCPCRPSQQLPTRQNRPAAEPAQAYTAHPAPQQTRRRNTVVNMRELTRLPPFGL